MKKILILLILLCTMLFALDKQHIMIDGLRRSYYVHVPKTYTGNKRVPLLIFLHGGGQNIKKMARKSLLNRLANKKKFIVVYPIGVDKHWNDGRGVNYGGKRQYNDVKFIKKLITRLSKQYAINKEKIYASGVSNGGIMTLRLGCELSDTLSAVAPVIANMPVRYTCRPKSPLSVLMMNGTADPIVPWQGGTMKLWKKTMGEVRSTQESITFWRIHNRCKKTPRIKQLPNTNKRDKSTVTVSRFVQCKHNTSVQLYTIEGGGHTLPSKKGFNMRRLVGEKNRDIEGIRVIVNFLLKH